MANAFSAAMRRISILGGQHGLVLEGRQRKQWAHVIPLVVLRGVIALDILSGRVVALLERLREVYTLVDDGVEVFVG